MGDWSIGGRGRALRSGRGFDELKEFGVVVPRCAGGHSRSGGRSGSFSLLLRAGLSDDEVECLSLSLSLSLVSPRLKRLKRAFMFAVVVGSQPRR